MGRFGAFSRILKEAEVVTKESKGLAKATGSVAKAENVASSAGKIAPRNFFYTRNPSASSVGRWRSSINEAAESGDLAGRKTWSDIRAEAVDSRGSGNEPLEQAAHDVDSWLRGGRVPRNAPLDEPSRQLIYDELGRRSAWYDENIDRLSRQKVTRKKSPNPVTSPQQAGIRTAKEHWIDTFRNTSLDGLFDK